MVVATNTDDTAVLVTLTARELAPNAKIVATVRESDNKHLLKQSGADSVVVSAETAGRLLGLATITPTVVGMMEDLLTPDEGFSIAERRVEESEVGGSPRHLAELVLGVVRKGQLIKVNEPEADALESVTGSSTSACPPADRPPPPTLVVDPRPRRTGPDTMPLDFALDSDPVLSVAAPDGAAPLPGRRPCPAAGPARIMRVDQRNRFAVGRPGTDVSASSGTGGVVRGRAAGRRRLPRPDRHWSPHLGRDRRQSAGAGRRSAAAGRTSLTDTARSPRSRRCSDGTGTTSGGEPQHHPDAPTPGGRSRTFHGGRVPPHRRP